MDSYQIIVDIVGIENDLEEPYSILFNVFECYKLDFIKRLTVENLEEFNKSLDLFLIKNQIKKENLKITNSQYKLKLFINKFLNLDIKYIKSNNSYDIDLHLIENNNRTPIINYPCYFEIETEKLIRIPPDVPGAPSDM